MTRPLSAAIVTALSCAFFACSSVTQDAGIPLPDTGSRASTSQASATGERLGADTAARTIEGNAFVAPAG